MTEPMTGGLGIIVAIFLIVLALLWFLLPFAIFGTKDKLAEIVAEGKKTNAELSRISSELSAVCAILSSQSAPSDSKITPTNLGSQVRSK